FEEKGIDDLIFAQGFDVLEQIYAERLSLDDYQLRVTGGLTVVPTQSASPTKHSNAPSLKRQDHQRDHKHQSSQPYQASSQSTRHDTEDSYRDYFRRQSSAAYAAPCSSSPDKPLQPKCNVCGSNMGTKYHSMLDDY
ncbi:MAG: hypothetical protein EBU08_14355, partial [Micrococcales bacterium]|nr:hypothetical protein [Micrococcales bacterium]